MVFGRVPRVPFIGTVAHLPASLALLITVYSHWLVGGYRSPAWSSDETKAKGTVPAPALLTAPG